MRSEILAFYDRGEPPSIKALYSRVKEPPVSFKGGKSSLWKLVRGLGFRYECSDKVSAVTDHNNVEGKSANRKMNWIIGRASPER